MLSRLILHTSGIFSGIHKYICVRINIVTEKDNVFIILKWFSFAMRMIEKYNNLDNISVQIL